MRVATVQDAVEGAPSVMMPDGHGGVVCALVTDEGALAVVKAICERNNWTEEEQTNLYHAVLLTLEELVEWTEEDIDRGYRLDAIEVSS